jgi:hypothetical protein
MPVRNRRSKAGPVAAASSFICRGVSMPGIMALSMSMPGIELMFMPGMLLWSMPAIPAMPAPFSAWPRRESQVFIIFISSFCEIEMRWPSSFMSARWVRSLSRVTISMAWPW